MNKELWVGLAELERAFRTRAPSKKKCVLAGSAKATEGCALARAHQD